MLTSFNSSSNNEKYLKFNGGKVESTRNSNFGHYPGDMVQNLESPGLSGRVDSTAYTRKPRASVRGKLDHCQNSNTYRNDSPKINCMLHRDFILVMTQYCSV